MRIDDLNLDRPVQQYFDQGLTKFASVLLVSQGMLSLVSLPSAHFNFYRGIRVGIKAGTHLNVINAYEASRTYLYILRVDFNMFGLPSMRSRSDVYAALGAFREIR